MNRAERRRRKKKRGKAMPKYICTSEPCTDRKGKVLKLADGEDATVGAILANMDQNYTALVMMGEILANQRLPYEMLLKAEHVTTALDDEDREVDVHGNEYIIVDNADLVAFQKKIEIVVGAKLPQNARIIQGIFEKAPDKIEKKVDGDNNEGDPKTGI
jgi:hypothetical protein